MPFDKWYDQTAMNVTGLASQSGPAPRRVASVLVIAAAAFARVFTEKHGVLRRLKIHHATTECHLINGTTRLL